MRQGKQIHQGYSFFWGVFLLLVMSAAISIHAEAPSTKELVLFKDTLKNDTIVPQSPKKNGTFVIRDRIPIPSDEPLFIVNGMELPYEIFAALNPAHIESLEVLKDASATAIYGTRGINGVIILKLKTPQQVKEEKNIKKIDDFLKPKGDGEGLFLKQRAERHGSTPRPRWCCEPHTVCGASASGKRQTAYSGLPFLPPDRSSA